MISVLLKLLRLSTLVDQQLIDISWQLEKELQPSVNGNRPSPGLLKLTKVISAQSALKEKEVEVLEVKQSSLVSSREMERSTLKLFQMPLRRHSKPLFVVELAKRVLSTLIPGEDTMAWLISGTKNTIE